MTENTKNFSSQESLPFVSLDSIAYWVSHILSPPLLALMGGIMCAFYVGDAWSWTAVHFLFSVFIPTGYIIWLVKTGQVTDLHLRLRHQRTKPSLVMIAGSILTWLILWQTDAPHLFLLFIAAQTIQGFVFFIITLYWQISIHSASAAVISVLASWIYGAMAVPLLLIPLIAWSRVRLGRHTIAQTIAGAALGSGTMITVLLMQ